MIESVMMDQEEIKDDQQQQGTTEEEEEEEDSSTDLVVPTETTVILVDDDDEDGRRVERSKETGFEMSKEEVSVVDKLKENVVEEEEEESEQPQTTTCVIDVKCSSNVVGGNCDVEKVCRICHLSADPPPSDNNNNNNSDSMIQLGCGCKGELGIAHRHCAETWFKLKGNRCCEICGEAAKNITGMWDDRFMEDWNDRRSVGSNSLDRRWGFWRGQPFCNFLMACLVMAFVLPWFFRVNMF